MYNMDRNVIVQSTEKVIARVQLNAFDNRTKKVEEYYLYCELTEEEQDVTPIVNRALKCLGFQNSGIINVETTSLPFDAQESFKQGLAAEQL